MKTIIKVGDNVIVKCEECNRNYDYLPAKVVAITDEPGKPVGVEFADPVGAHSCDGAGRDKHCLWVVPDHVFSPKEAEDHKKLNAALTRPAPSLKKPMVLHVDDGKRTVVPV